MTHATFPAGFQPLSGTVQDCQDCARGERVGFSFDYAFQPIVDLRTRGVFAHEALVRGPAGEGAGSVLAQVTEGERVEDGPWFAQILREYKRFGFKTAIDDFGAGYAGLKLLADFQPDLIKIDMDLIRHIDQQPAKQAIVRHLVRLCEEMRIDVIAEGIETPAERDFLRDAGIHLMQGYLFAKPAFKAVAPVQAAAWG